MSIPGFNQGELLEIIEFQDDSRDILSWRFPDDDHAIKNGAQLIVRESQAAQLVYLGQYGDCFGPGKHSLITENIPALTQLKGWKYGFGSPFKADVHFVTTRLFTGNKWGTSNPVMMPDPDFNVVRLRACGTFDFKISEPPVFLREVAGTDHPFRLDEFADLMRSRIVSVFSEALASSGIPALEVAARYSELGDALLPLINPQTTSKYGIEITSFILENISLPPEVEAASGKRNATQRAMDSGWTHERMETLQQPPPAHGATPANALPIPELLSPAEAAQALGVSETDVLATLESGELKGRKIGSTWRITKTALDAYLAH
jgi:excisionase family DNA binding protein